MMGQNKDRKVVMFEVIQSNGQSFQFGENFYWEYFSEEMASAPTSIAEDRRIVIVYKLDNNDERIDVTTFFCPIRIDNIVDGQSLMPAHWYMQFGARCERCGHVQLPKRRHDDPTR